MDIIHPYGLAVTKRSCETLKNTHSFDHFPVMKKSQQIFRKV